MHWAGCAGIVTLVDSPAVLLQHSQYLHTAVVCGIDAEWPPQHTAAGPRAAAVVQLACWSLAHGLRVLVLDLLSLPAELVRTTLQQVFRNPATLKLGYSLHADLRAVAAALGPHGGGCIAVVDPVVDVGDLHDHLLACGAPGVSGRCGSGLSGLVQSLLGAPLDKAQQCSAWGERPLSAAQVKYAAADAGCLLALLDASLRLLEGRSGGGGGGGASQSVLHLEPSWSSSVGSPLLKSMQGAEDTVASAAAAIGEDRPSVPACAAASGVESPESPEISWTEAGLGQAAAAWGSRLEVQGGRVKWRGGLRERPKQQRRVSNDADAGPPLSQLPAHVPWMDAYRRLTGPPRFLADVMAHGLARQLRLWGVDAEHVEIAGKGERHVTHRRLVERAHEENRVILTRDVGFLRRNLSDHVYLVRSTTKREQVREVVQAFSLPVDERALLSRCSRCNGEFVDQPLPAAALKPGHGVPPGVAQRVQQFWVCSRCDVAYWQGNMYARAMERLSASMAAMATGEGGEGRDTAGASTEIAACR